MLQHVSANQIWLGLLVLRVSVGVTMIAHGYNHIYRGGKIKGTAGWFASLGQKERESCLQYLGSGCLIDRNLQ